MLKCKSCGKIIIEKNKCMGICAECGRNSLEHILIKCPECHKDLGQETICDINNIGWGCTNCKIKIYKEI